MLLFVASNMCSSGRVVLNGMSPEEHSPVYVHIQSREQRNFVHEMNNIYSGVVLTMISLNNLSAA